MPIYEYECRGCGSQWDELQKMSDKPVRKCPECGARRAHRLISRSSFVLKGSGWYVTDYGKGTGGQAGEKKGCSKSSTSPSSSSDTKKTTKSSSKTTKKSDD